MRLLHNRLRPDNDVLSQCSFSKINAMQTTVGCSLRLLRLSYIISDVFQIQYPSQNQKFSKKKILISINFARQSYTGHIIRYFYIICKRTATVQYTALKFRLNI